MNHKKLTEQLLNAITLAESTLRLRDEEYIKQNAEKLELNLSAVTKSFSGSWLGYHSKVYYQGFTAPAPGDHFSVEWGLMHRMSHRDSGCWIEVSEEQVYAFIMRDIDGQYKDRLSKISVGAKDAAKEVHAVLSMLLTLLLESANDGFLTDLNKELAGVPCFFDEGAIINQLRPRGSVVSRDSTALTSGYKTPPHIQMVAWLGAQLSPFDGLAKLNGIASKILKYMEMKDLLEFKTVAHGSKIFIGHGQSQVWKEISYFLNEKKLEWDEFNRDPVAGLTIQERLEAMLEKAGLALIVMTSEDEHKDATLHARENVVHECGLFQGKLGFRRAIILLEEGCETFSNIQGLVQLRFPKNKIGACFPELRRVLEREGFRTV